MMAHQGGGGPPPNPVSGGPPPMQQQQRPLSGAERAALSAQQAEQSGAYAQAAPAQPQRPQMGGNRMNLLAGIQKGAKLRKKGQTGLKKVAEEEKNVRVEEKQDATIFAILNRRQFMADDSDSESGSSWDSDES